MRFSRSGSFRVALLLALAGGPTLFPALASAQRSDPIKTPLPQELMDLFANEVNGQLAFDNMVKLAGAPWLRTPEELTGETNFHESEELYRMARAYGIETVRFDRYEAPGTFTYPKEGELWVHDRRMARVPADPALLARGSRTGEVEGPLIFVPPASGEELGALEAAMDASPEQYRGAVALMWAHPRGALFQALDRAGVQGVISFGSRERYFDPDQVVYASGSYSEGENLRLGLTVSWRQWSEMLEDLQMGMEIPIRAHAVMETFPNRFETVYAWIPGTETEEPGVVFTAHLFEGYTKRGANDNMGGPAIQLEILRALHDLIEAGDLPRPRRTIHFIWPNEISGTYEFLRRDPELLERLSININMDMVSEGLRKANSWFTMSETPAHLASYYDGLAASVLNYLWRTNDIVYLPGPRGRPGGQYFPDPMWAKNGSRDAFRFFIHEATGGSDHIVFNNASVGVPGIEFFTWPDQWYHADTDTPDKGDPTEMRRVAFIGATTAWASAHLTDDMLPDLLDVVSDFGYRRLAERGIPRALEVLDEAAAAGADGAEAEAALSRAWFTLSGALAREEDAIRSVHAIHSGTPVAREAVDARAREWVTGYREGMDDVLLAAARARGLPAATLPTPTAREREYMERVPSLAPGIRGVETSLARFGPMVEWTESNPTVLADMGLGRGVTGQILNFINGERSVTEILYRVRGVTGLDLSLDQLIAYLAILEEVGWVRLGESAAGRYGREQAAPTSPNPVIDPPRDPVGTFSIVGFDPETQAIGVAVQSRVFSVGNGVIWGEAGVGVVATQAWVDVSYGPQGLALLKEGLAPQDVVNRILAQDPDPRGERWPKAGRQFSVMDREGNVATHTGPSASDWAGHKIGRYCSAQGNILAGPGVVEGMVEAFENTQGHLSFRLLAALDAGQAAGGDTRGMQSAAMLIVKEDGGVWLNNHVVLRLQVDDAEDPIAELRRLVELAARQRGGDRR